MGRVGQQRPHPAPHHSRNPALHTMPRVQCAARCSYRCRAITPGCPATTAVNVVAHLRLSSFPFLRVSLVLPLLGPSLPPSLWVVRFRRRGLGRLLCRCRDVASRQVVHDHDALCGQRRGKGLARRHAPAGATPNCVRDGCVCQRGNVGTGATSATRHGTVGDYNKSFQGHYRRARHTALPTPHRRVSLSLPITPTHGTTSPWNASACR